MPAHYEYAYTTGTLPATPIKSIEYHYNDSSWSDVLTGISEVTYTNSNTSTASAYSLNGATNESSETDTIEFDALAQSLLGNNYRKVDLTDNAVVNVGNDALVVPSTNTSTYSTNSVTTNSTTLYTFQSDEIGNITNVSGVVDLEWNGRRLESISQGGTEILSYKYNIDGQRVSKTVTDPETNEVTTTEYFYNGSILAGQKTGDNVLIFMYDNNGDVFGFTYNGTPYYYVKNAQNDVFLIVDETGEPVVIYQYDAWGKFGCYDATEENIASVNPITYRSYYVDLEMGFFMYYLNSRYYMADWGRFISADTTDILSVQSDLYDKNLFAYCDNNPVVRADNGGEFWNYVIGGLVGAVASGISAAISGGDWKTIILNTSIGAIGGVLAASGLSIGIQVVAGGLLSGGSSLANQMIIEGKTLKEVDWLDVGIDTAIGVGASVLSYRVTKSASDAAGKVINRGVNKIVKGQQSLLSGSKYGNGAIKRGTTILNDGIKQLNTVRGTSSVVGSTTGGFFASVKSFFKRVFG